MPALPTELTPDLLLSAYASGVFPMDDPERGLLWFRPDPRGLIPLDDRFRVTKNLAKTVRRGVFDVRVDTAFEAVMRACGDRDETWISPRLVDAYGRLHTLGFAHSVECWQQGVLVGGLYGVALGSAFFGESMFHTARDASKVALVHLVEQLRVGGFTLLDTQWLTPHLASFGGYEVAADEYENLLREALSGDATW